MKTLEWTKREKEGLIKQQAILDLVEKHAEFFDSFKEDSLQNLLSSLDINNPTREQALATIKYFPGKWSKEYMSTGINYTTEVDGITIRLYCAPPPPSCKIVTEERLMPARLVPEHIEKHSRVVCNDGQEQQSTELSDEDINS